MLTIIEIDRLADLPNVELGELGHNLPDPLGGEMYLYVEPSTKRRRRFVVLEKVEREERER